MCLFSSKGWNSYVKQWMMSGFTSSWYLKLRQFLAQFFCYNNNIFTLDSKGCQTYK